MILQDHKWWGGLLFSLAEPRTHLLPTGESPNVPGPMFSVASTQKKMGKAPVVERTFLERYEMQIV